MDQHPGQVAPYGQGANSSTKNKLMNSKFRERRRRRRGAKCNSTAVSNSGPADDVNRTIKETVSNCDDYPPSPGGGGEDGLSWSGRGVRKQDAKRSNSHLQPPQRNTRNCNDRDRCAVSCKKIPNFHKKKLWETNVIFVKIKGRIQTKSFLLDHLRRKLFFPWQKISAWKFHTNWTPKEWWII